ncbi:hypothetical protein F4778DRAFT_774332 [Xylariomycetidae sp. FL2044]|nr:hypothetical protein F4778DRAFT_774332 [Xylariomycetidae sp. FL2044]
MPLKPAVSSLARQTIQLAFEDLEQTITPADSRDFTSTTLQHVKQAVLDIENQLAARQSLRNLKRLAPLFQGLEHYSKAVDVLCNGTPFLPWIWSPITLILRVSSEYVEAFEHIIKGYSQIAESLGRFGKLQGVYSQNPDFQQTIAIFYSDILKFHKYAYRFVRQSGWKLLFVTSWGRFQRRFDNILEDMRRHGELVDKEANANHILETRQMRQEMREWREESLASVDQFEKGQGAKQYNAIVSWLRVDDSEQLAIVDSIPGESAEYVAGTCGWVLQNRTIKSWLESKPDMQFVWLQGNPGSGKSVLSTQLIAFMKAKGLPVVHHFCTDSYSASMEYDQILKSLIIQLLRRDGELVAHVYAEHVLGKKLPTIPVLENLAQTVFSNLSHEPTKAEHIWVLIDGVDACENEKQASAVRLINRITSRSTSTRSNTICKTLISSRTSPVLSKGLAKRHIVSLTEEKAHIGSAIKYYASQRLHSLSHRLDQLDVQPSDIQDIENSIVERSDGMFLYARLVLDYLASNVFYNAEEIKTSLRELPQELSDFYHKILSQILARLDERSVDRIRCVFGWIAYAKRPLKRLELLSAVSFSTGDPHINHIAPQYILDICGSLIDQRGNTTVNFIHVSVKDFLQFGSGGLRIQQQQAADEHGLAVITALLAGVDAFDCTKGDNAKYIRIIKGVHGIHVYATEYWTDYLLNHLTRTSSGSATRLLTMACELAKSLSEKEATPTISDPKLHESPPVDERMTVLEPYPLLYRQVRQSHASRSLEKLEQAILQIHDSQGTSQEPPASSNESGIAVMLDSYQAVVRRLLEQHDHPGVTASEMALFKSQFRSSAFTCRLGSCPRATIGFETEKLCHEHEANHSRRLSCSVPGCQYPPFGTTHALQRHLKTHHNSNPARKTIRRRVPVDTEKKVDILRRWGQNDQRAMDSRP